MRLRSEYRAHAEPGAAPAQWRYDSEQSGRGRVIKRLLDEEQATEQIIESLYIRSLSRRPTVDETERLVALVDEAGDPQAGLQDVFWALLNSREFLFNH